MNGDPDNPARSKRVDQQWARDQIAKYGRDNPWVLINVFGEFPPSSINTLIGPDEITAASRRSYRSDDLMGMPRILGVDVALYGDDASVIWPRQGIVAFAPTIYRNVDAAQGAGMLLRKWEDWEASAVFIDDTGGYGAAWISQLRQLGRSPFGIGFATSPNDSKFANKRAEIYFEAVQWIRQGGQLPPMSTPGMAELTAALTRTTYSAPKGRLIL